MSEVYVVKNQDGYFASKQKEWVDGRDPKTLFRSPHKDEAINMVFEISSKDIYVRAIAEQVELDDKKHPIVEVTAPEPEPEPEAQTEIELADAGEETSMQEEPAPTEQAEETSDEPKEMTASERLSMLAARLREQEEV